MSSATNREDISRWAAVLGTGRNGEVPAVRVYDGWIVELPPGKSAGDEVSPDAAEYGVSVSIGGKLTRIPGRHKPSDPRWTDVDGIDFLIVPPLGTPVRMLDISGEYRLLMLQQEFPAITQCAGGVGGLGDVPDGPGAGPASPLRSPVRSFLGAVADRLLPRPGGGGGREAGDMGPRRRKVVKTAVLDQRYLGDQVVLDCSRILDGVQVYVSLEDGTISTGELAVERSFDGIEWVPFDPAITIDTDDAAPFAVDAKLLHSIRVRISSSTGIDPARWRVTLIGIEES